MSVCLFMHIPTWKALHFATIPFILCFEDANLPPRERLTGLQPTTDFKCRIALSIPPRNLLTHINYALGVGSLS